MPWHGATIADMTDATEQPERLVVRLSADASPKRVADVATMLHEVLDALLEGDDAAEITLVVGNRETVAELRGWDERGRAAVRDVAGIVENPTRAMQEDSRRTAAALVLAEHVDCLVPYSPRFYRDNREIAKADHVFVTSMRAVAEAKPPTQSTTVKGTTVAFVTVLRVGRRFENAPLCARMRLNGASKPRDIEIPESLADHFFDAAKHGDLVSVELLCEWKRVHGDTPKLISARVIGVDRRFKPWSGARLLKEVADSSVPFTREDYDQVINSLRREEHE